MKINTLTPKSKDYPEILQNIEGKPRTLYHSGAELNKLLRRPAVAIVGSRKTSYYGREVTRQIARDLAEQGVVIISGLALGTDGIAHRAALEVGGLCIGVLPCPLDRIVPSSNYNLAQDILAKGGALVSEYPSGQDTYKQNFIERNRIVAWLSQAVLITEAAEKSGTMHTARFARAEHRDLMIVPGRVTDFSYVGSHNLLKTGAHPITSFKDVMNVLNLSVHQTAARAIKGSNANEQKILDLIMEGYRDGDAILKASGIPLHDFDVALTMLELNSKIQAEGMNYWRIY